jgi:hypothetical protein
MAVRQPIKALGYIEWMRGIVDNMHALTDECLIWPWHKATKGIKIRLMNKEYIINRLMCEAAHGPATFENAQALHSCGKGHLACVNPKHLRWGTPKENAEDALKHGTHPKGQNHGSSKLTEAMVVQIRLMYAEGTRKRDIGRKFGVTRQNVSCIVKGATWKHI